MKKYSTVDKANYFTELRRTESAAGAFNIHYMPEDIHEAYTIQKLVIEQLQNKVLGWKLGGTNPKTQAIFKCDSGYLGPIFSIGETTPTYFDNEKLRGEAELTFRISKEIYNLNMNNILDSPLIYFDAVYPSIEFPHSQINNFHEVGMLPLIADLCGTGHLVVGQSIDIMEMPDKPVDAKVKLATSELARGNSANLVGSYQTALSDFLKLVLEYSLRIAPGQLVASGGITDCIFLPKHEKIDVEFSGFEAFTYQYI